MEKQILTEILVDQKKSFEERENIIPRQLDFKPLIKTKQIVIISGMRRCGKSTLLFLLKEAMKLKPAHYCYVNFDDNRLTLSRTLLDEIFALHVELYGHEPVLLLDEIQLVPLWEKFLNRQYERGIKIVATGSNAGLLSSEIATSLTGRNKTLHLYPFSFREFLTFKKQPTTDAPASLSSIQKAKMQRLFNEYVQFGGLPLLVKEKDVELAQQYFQDILYRDIIARYRLTQVEEIKNLCSYLFSNPAKLFSYSTLQAITGIKSLSTIKDYLTYLENSYLFFYQRKFDYSVKKQIMNPKKLYVADSVFIHRLGFNFSANRGRVLENIVFVELARRHAENFYYTGKHECDFVVKKKSKVAEAIQVTTSLRVSNFDREINGLLEAMKTFSLKSGLLLVDDSKTIHDFTLPKSIHAMPLWEWLVNEE